MNKKVFVHVLTALIINAIVGATIASLLGCSAVGGAGVACLIAVAAGMWMPKGSANEGVLAEVWTGELIRALRGYLDASWLVGVPDQSSIVNNDVIHMVDVGADPAVLINNTTYPIDIQELDDGDKTFSLDKFQTKVVPVTDDELYALSYDKMSRVKESCANALNDAKYAKAAHALCPKQNTATTPVLKTTGAVDAATGRIKLCAQDVINLKRALDKLGVPSTQRRLVLCPDHVNDLLETEQAFKEMYNINRSDGTVGKMFGFEIYESNYNPTYTTAGVKNDVGATPKTGEFQASFAFYVPRVFKATGSTKMYYSPAENDPQQQRNLVSYRHYFIALPKKEDAGGAIYSGYQAPSTGGSATE